METTCLPPPQARRPQKQHLHFSEKYTVMNTRPRRRIALALWLVLTCCRSSCHSASSLATFSRFATVRHPLSGSPTRILASGKVRRKIWAPTSLNIASASPRMVADADKRILEYEANETIDGQPSNSQPQLQEPMTPLSSANPPPRLPFDFDDVRRSAAASTKAVRRQLSKTVPIVLKKIGSQMDGSYYGITQSTYLKASSVNGDGKGLFSRGPSVAENLSEALIELKTMRLEMEAMRKEMQVLKRGMISEGYLDESSIDFSPMSSGDKSNRQREFDNMAADIEKWAETLLAQGEDDGWKQVKCNKVMRKSFNAGEQTEMFIKWMKDSRGKGAAEGDESEYPCMKVCAVIDAPLDDVCAYLAQEQTLPEYNELVVEHKEVEVLSPHSKICWSQTPQILFLKPRDFVTFCHHRWRRDGTSVIVNQAVEHVDYPGTDDDKDNKACRAYALRGANFFSKLPGNPQKTRVVIVAHANPGGGVPKWATKTAINTLAPIEPFKLFHKINEGVQQNPEKIQEWVSQAKLTPAQSGRSSKPTGIAQMGYACFWPKGGGQVEGMVDNEARVAAKAGL